MLLVKLLRNAGS